MQAQVTTGSIFGTIYDSEDVVLPHATVTATNVNTGTTHQAQSGNSGDYVSILAAPKWRARAIQYQKLVLKDIAEGNF